MFNNRSKCAFISALLGTLYAIYIVVYFMNGMASSSTDSEVVGGALATMLVTPHIILVILASIFMWLGFFLRKPGFDLTGAILYTVGGVMFLLYIFFVIPSFVLGYVAFSKQKKINLAAQNPEAAA